MRRDALLVAVLAVIAVGSEHATGDGDRPAQAAASSAAPAAARQAAPAPVRVLATSRPVAAPDRALVQKYCVTCHSDRLKTGGLSLQNDDPAASVLDAELWEKVLQKLHGGMMPPQGMPRPDAATLDSFVTSLERVLDRQAASAVNPGHKPPHRLNRTEYGNAIRDLLDLEHRPGDPAAGRRREPRLRQHRRRAAHLAVAARAVPRRRARKREQPRRRHRHGRRPPRPSACRPTIRRRITWTACRSAPAAAWRSPTPSRRTPSTSSACCCCATSSAT